MLAINILNVSASESDTLAIVPAGWFLSTGSSYSLQAQIRTPDGSIETVVEGVEWAVLGQSSALTVFDAGSLIIAEDETAPFIDVIAYMPDWGDEGLEAEAARFYITENMAPLEGELIQDAPLLTVASVSSSSFMLKIPPVAGAESYDIYVCIAGSNEYKLLANMKHPEVYRKVSGFECGVKYYFKCVPIAYANSEKVTGPPSKIVQIKARPLEPRLIKASSTALGGIKVSWEPVDDSDGYAIYRRNTKTGESKLLATVESKSAKSFTDNTVASKTAYIYTVKSFKKTADSRVLSVSSEAVEAVSR
jgi:hypothetical protein